MKKTRVALLVTLGVVAGFVIGYICPPFDQNSGNVKGDITKVSRYSKNVVSPQASAYQEMIMNDEQEMEKAKASLVVLSTRLRDFESLVNLSTEACEGIDELAPAVARLQRISTLSSNAKNAADEAMNSFDEMVKGSSKAAADYEMASQNLSLAFLMVDRQMNVGKEFVSDIDAYMKGKNAEDNLSLAFSRDLWAGYCAGEAILNGDEDELAYWSKKDALVSNETLGSLFNGNTGHVIANFEGQIETIKSVFGDNGAIVQSVFGGEGGKLEASSVFGDGSVLKSVFDVSSGMVRSTEVDGSAVIRSFGSMEGGGMMQAMGQITDGVVLVKNGDGAAKTVLGNGTDVTKSIIDCIGVGEAAGVMNNIQGIKEVRFTR